MFRTTPAFSVHSDMSSNDANLANGAHVSSAIILKHRVKMGRAK